MIVEEDTADCVGGVDKNAVDGKTGDSGAVEKALTPF
jgi:hypothetical protein